MELYYGLLAACLSLLAGSKQNRFINFFKEGNSLMVYFYFFNIYCFYQVAVGQEICVIEAMKMQNSLPAGETGKVCVSYTLTILDRLNITLFKERITQKIWHYRVLY